MFSRSPRPSGHHIVTRLEAREIAARLEAYREVFADQRPADMPAISSAIRRYRAIAGGEARPDERASA